MDGEIHPRPRSRFKSASIRNVKTFNFSVPCKDIVHNFWPYLVRKLTRDNFSGYLLVKYFHNEI